MAIKEFKLFKYTLYDQPCRNTPLQLTQSCYFAMRFHLGNFSFRQHQKESLLPSDVQLFLILIPLINILNYYLTYPVIHWGIMLVLTFVVDIIEGYLAWLACRQVILYLDKRIPFDQYPARRLFIQVILTTIVFLLVTSALTEGVNWLASDKPVPIQFYTNYIFIFFIWVLVMNGVYVGLYYYQQFQQVKQDHQQAQEILKSRDGNVVVKLGKQDIAISHQDIAGFRIEGDYTYVFTLQSKKHYLDMSLDQLEVELPAQFFFRVNRQYILHRQAISAFKRIENSKLQLSIQDILTPANEEIIVSRTKAPAFKEWFRT